MEKKVVDTLKAINDTTTKRVGQKKSRSLKITGASCVGNSIIGIGKLFMGIFTLSFFTCASALYTFGMVTAKCFALAGIVKEEYSREQYWYYKMAGTVLIASSILYMIYSGRLFIYPENMKVNQIAGIAIAAFTFAEIFLNIRGVVIERHNKSPLMHAIKMINLASSLISLVLTQAALLSFTSEATEIHPRANGLMGILMGAVATLLGVFMIQRIRRIQLEDRIRQRRMEKQKEISCK